MVGASLHGLEPLLARIAEWPAAVVHLNHVVNPIIIFDWNLKFGLDEEKKISLLDHLNLQLL